MMRAALKYAAAGIPVFPCRKDKKPFTAHGFKDATTDPVQIRVWFAKWPTAMVAMPTGEASGYDVVDVDKTGALPMRQPKGAPKARTPSGGFHLFFPANGLRNSEDKGGTNVDVRGEGGYVILPPSANGRGAYKWVGPDLNGETPQMPSELRTWLDSRRRRNGAPNPSKAGRSNVRGQKRGVRRSKAKDVAPGDRHNALMSLAGGLWNRGLAPNAILESLEAFNAGLPEPLAGERLKELPLMVTYLEDKAAASEDEFWAATKILGQIRAHAQANRVAPLAVLGCVLARVSAVTHPCVRLPGRGQGSNLGSLNTFVALVGEPGKGKDQALAEAREAIELGDDDETVVRLGSGEGIAHIFKRRVKGEEEWVRNAVLVQESEVETLTTLGGRRGSTLMSELRSVWTGGTLGHAFVDPQKRLNVPAHSYRLALVVGVQPSKAGGLLADADGGMPQRFLWLTCGDRYAPDDVSELTVERMPLQLAHTGQNLVGEIVMPVCDEALHAIDCHARRSLLGLDGDPLFGHWLLCKLKVATLLAILHGCTEVDAQWWGLAEWVMRRSDEGRSVCAYYSWLEDDRRTKTRARREATVARETTLASADATEERLKERCRASVLRKTTRTTWTKEREISHSLGRTEVREHLPDVLKELLADGSLKRRKIKPKSGPSSWHYMKP